MKKILIVFLMNLMISGFAIADANNKEVLEKDVNGILLTSKSDFKKAES